MCGEDDMKRAVYNMKRKHAKKGSEHKKRHKEHSGKKLRNQRTLLVSRKANCYIDSNPSINVRLNRFTFKN